MDYLSGTQKIDRSASKGIAIIPHNATDLIEGITRGVYVGTTGDLNVLWEDESEVVFKGVPNGTILPIRAKRIFQSGTTATNLIALY